MLPDKPLSSRSPDQAQSASRPNLSAGLTMSKTAMGINFALAGIKVTAGLLGRSYALVADGIESTLDIASSFLVWIGLRVAARPADQTHPYGHGKAESIAALAVSLLLVLAAFFIALQSLKEILSPNHVPAPFTLVVLVVVVVIKEFLFRRVSRVGQALNSSSLRSDAWHHRSDAITSLAAFVGISIAVVGGERFAAADDWAALLACGIILWNGLRLLRLPLDEVMDAAASDDVVQAVRSVVEGTAGVLYAEKCRVRKSGGDYLADIHITVNRHLTVEKGHQIAHQVKDRLAASDLPMGDVSVHVEPDNL